jgi:hypothetical protein
VYTVFNCQYSFHCLILFCARSEINYFHFIFFRLFCGSGSNLSNSSAPPTSPEKCCRILNTYRSSCTFLAAKIFLKDHFAFRILSESFTKCPALYIMFPWYGGQGWNFRREGLLVHYTLWGEAMLFFSQTGVPVAGGGARSNLPVGKYWPFLPVSHSSIFLWNSLRNSSSVTLRYTSCFICVVRNLFRKRRHTFRTVYR